MDAGALPCISKWRTHLKWTRERWLEEWGKVLRRLSFEKSRLASVPPSSSSSSQPYSLHPPLSFQSPPTSSQVITCILNSPLHRTMIISEIRACGITMLELKLFKHFQCVLLGQGWLHSPLPCLICLCLSSFYFSMFPLTKQLLERMRRKRGPHSLLGLWVVTWLQLSLLGEAPTYAWILLNSSPVSP